ncbi:hypothetical protein B5F76_13910 [Desulfovibrio sp. An276]|uniref:hypothetical protein n=1 Tax=Desulfovibrio sp. An276 TaxID=1965618 RepID=UPI000B370B0D|nr:hypothetical protein [Desulfovibrio sp. An276]OUO49423.1 hypothetical protein B5F76_13910 [Desulfovibrio sp. An276]
MHETSTQDTRVDFSSGSCGFRCSCPGTPYAFDVPLILVGLMVLVQTALVCVLAFNHLDRTARGPERGTYTLSDTAGKPASGAFTHAGGAAVVTGQVQGTHPHASSSGPAVPVTDAAGYESGVLQGPATRLDTQLQGHIVQGAGHKRFREAMSGTMPGSDLESALAALLARYPHAELHNLRAGTDDEVNPIPFGARKAFEAQAYPALRITAEGREHKVPDIDTNMNPRDLEAILAKLASARTVSRARVDELLARVPGVLLAKDKDKALDRTMALLVFTEPDCPHCKRAQGLLQGLPLSFPVLLMPVGSGPSSLALYTREGTRPSQGELELVHSWLGLASDWFVGTCGAKTFVPTFLWIRDNEARMGTLNSRELLVLLAMLNAQGTTSAQPLPKGGAAHEQAGLSRATQSKQPSNLQSNPKSNP